MKYIVNVSGGLSSFEALRRTIAWYGVENTIPIFADTKIEDQDLYRFLRDQEKLFRIEIIRISDGRTPMQVMKDNRAITVRGAAICSRILKRELITSYISENIKEEYTEVFGLDWTELHRIEKIRKLRKVPTLFPLTQPKLLVKEEIAEWLSKNGIAVPSLYKLGFNHNNCGGGCVRAGKSHWIHLLKTIPKRYYIWEKWEQDMQEMLGWPVTILKDISLRDLRLSYISGCEITQDEWGGCGCFSDN